jgi:hypothetical protein
MLVTIAVAALSYVGAKGNYRNALKIANSMPTSGLPALATAVGPTSSGAGAGTGVEIGPGVGGIGTAGAQMTKHHDEGGGSHEPSAPDAAELRKELEQIKEKLDSGRKLSGKEKQALRARKKQIREQLGETTNEPESQDVPTPTKFKDRISGLTDKEAATDIPSWTDKWPDARPGMEESGTTFATRMMNKKYGVGQWERTGQQGTEFSQLKKFGDRAFE